MAHGLSLLFGLAPSRSRRLGLGALLLFVLAVHGCVTHQVLSRMADIDAAQAMPPRMEVAYVRDMALSTPPPAAAPAAPPVGVRARTARPPRPPRAASAPPARAEPPSVVVVAAPPPVDGPTAVAAPNADDGNDRNDRDDLGEVGESLALPRQFSAAEPAASSPPTAAAPAAAPASAPAASALARFEWPASTRISYGLTGNYRGEVNGTAQVEWIRAGADYQVHLDLVVGPDFAPLITRRMTSDGAITAEGLAPRRYDEDTQVVLRERSRVTIRFEPGSVVLANGERRDTVPGVQDTASQFVQLTYVFSTRPELLRIGGTVDIPLALKNKVDVWTYDVVDEEVLSTAFGPLPTLHLKPRRAAQKPGDLSAEIWFAPQLRYLPVRIRIQQDPQTFIDLMISKRPELGP